MLHINKFFVSVIFVVSFFALAIMHNSKSSKVSFPSGTYLSYTMYIGSGEGHNWWCVLYPPLCFVDASSGILPESSKEIIKENISEEDYSYISEDNTVFRFKYLTFLNKLFK